MLHNATSICGIIVAWKIKITLGRQEKDLSRVFYCLFGGCGQNMEEGIKRHELAEADYMSGMKYKDIAGKYNVSLNTVKSWKQRYGWDKKGVHTNKKVRTQGEKGAYSDKQKTCQEVEEVISNDRLSSKQQLFCIYYIRCFNATKAYQKAYGVDYATASSISYRLLANDGVREEIRRLKKSRLDRELLSEEDIVQMYIDILYADINDYIDVKNNMVNLSRPCADGRLVKKVSFGKTDSVELLDKMAALRWLSDHMDLATEKQRAEIELLKAKAEKDGAPGYDAGDDGFLDALGTSAEEDWKEEADGEEA